MMRMLGNTRLFSFVFGLLSLCITGQALAVVIYDAGGPNNAQWRNSDYSNLYNGQAADDFMLTSDSAVTNVHWYGSYLFTPSQPMPDEFTINFYGDIANDPALVPFHTASFTGTVNRTFAGDVVDTAYGSFEMYEYDVDIAPLDLMGDTRYWLSIVNNTYDPAEYGGWGWAYNNESSTHRWRRYNGAWETYGSNNLAFSLSNNVSVPEPASITLMGLGLLGLAFSRRRTV